MARTGASQMTRKATNRKTGNKSDGYAREPNGQLSRRQADMANRAFSQYSAEERETMETGLAARERVHGLPRVKQGPKGQPVAVSRDPMAGSFVGRLCIQGEITVAQYDALMTWLRQTEDYARARRLPRPPGAVRISDAPRGGFDGDGENVGWALDVTAKMKNAKDAVQAAQYEPSNQAGARFGMLGVLWHLVEQDMERMDMVPTLRTVANVLCRHYKLESGRKAA